MRVTDGQVYRRFLASLGSNDETIQRALEQLADGKRVRVGSDDPAATQVALGVRGRLAAIDGYRRSTQAARSDLEMLEAALGRMVDLAIDAATRGEAAASTTAEGAGPVLATEIDDIRAQLITLGNTRHGGRYLFGGTQTLAPPFDAAGTYAGDASRSEAAVDRSRTVTTTLSGAEALQDGVDLLQVLDDLAAAMRSGDEDAVRALLPDLSTAAETLRLVRSDVGLRLRQVDDQTLRLGDEDLLLRRRLGELEDVDLATAAVELASSTSANEALSQAAARVLGRSLFDYLG